MSSFKVFSVGNLNVELIGESFYRATLILQPFWKIMTYWLTSSNIHHWQQNSTSKSLHSWDWLLEMFSLSIDYRKELELFNLHHSKYLHFLEWTATKCLNPNFIYTGNVDSYRYWYLLTYKTTTSESVIILLNFT